MIIAIGSTNQVKIQALEEIIHHYPLLNHAKVLSCNVPSEVADQPLSLAETIRGAKNRAKNSFQSCENCTYGFGLESGLIEAPGTQTGFLEVSICCIHDGINFHIGLSCGFEVPPQILSCVLNEKMDLQKACHHTKITDNPKLGSSEGLIGILTKSRIPRKEYSKQSIMTALVQLENAALYLEDPFNEIKKSS